MNDFHQKVREAVFDNVVTVVKRKLYDPQLNGVDWNHVAAAHRISIISSSNPNDFELRMNDMLRELHVSHTGFFSEKRPLAGAKIAIGATFHNGGNHWVFQDVHPGGPAQAAGITPGDVLLAVGGAESAPPQMPVFALGETVLVDLLRRDGKRASVKLHVPVSKKNNRPLVELQPVSWTRLPSEVGYIRIAMFPGVVGIDVAHDVDRAVRELAPERLIIDLRGNSGGGMGCLRVMSYLTPVSLPVGYSVTRRDLERKAFDKNRLPRFDRIPEHKVGLIPLMIRYATHGRSVAVFTEGKGDYRFQGRTVILVNEHSASSSEMVTAFAGENGLAGVVGSRTAGRLLGGNSFKVGHGYRVAIPVVAYRTWSGSKLEGRGIEPDLAVPFSPEALRNGVDTQLKAAVEMLERTDTPLKCEAN